MTHKQTMVFIVIVVFIVLVAADIAARTGAAAVVRGALRSL